MEKSMSLSDKLKKGLGRDFPEAVEENRRLLLSVTIIFLISIASVVILHQMGDNPVNRAIENQFEPFRDIIEEEIQGQESSLELTAFFLRKNLTNSLLIVGSGVVFGVFPFFSLLTNGLSVGYFTSISQYSTLEILSLLLPHGVFELSGYILAIGSGMRLGIGSIKTVYERKISPLKEAGRSVSPLIPPIVLFILIAAFVEGLIGAHQNIILSSMLLKLMIVGLSIVNLVLILLWMGNRLGLASS